MISAKERATQHGYGRIPFVFFFFPTASATIASNAEFPLYAQSGAYSRTQDRCKTRVFHVPLSQPDAPTSDHSAHSFSSGSSS